MSDARRSPKASRPTLFVFCQRICSSISRSGASISDVEWFLTLCMPMRETTRKLRHDKGSGTSSQQSQTVAGMDHSESSMSRFENEMPRQRRMPHASVWHRLLTLTLLITFVAVAATGWFSWYMHFGSPQYERPSSLPRVEFKDGAAVVRMVNGNLVGLVGSYSEELSAYLRFQYVQGLKGLAGHTVLMAVTEEPSATRYKLYVLLQNDLLSQTNLLADLQIHGYIASFTTDSPPSSEIAEWQRQTRLFDAAYHRPVQERLMQLPRSALTSAVAKFILFKTRTDRRARERLEPVVDKALTAEDAHESAADMIDVAKFYDIPLDMLLGIGAMENNYLDVRGDLQHAVWKKRAARGDIVLKRRKGRVLVSNYSLGPWQITRETLRYVHGLYRNDKRDYSKLPERLRPPKTLDLDHVETHVLTTYAGLLLRRLLDYFDGDIVKAQGAYNGGAGRPNLHYSEGVSIVSDYAHRVLSTAAGRNGNSIAETPLAVTNR